MIFELLLAGLVAAVVWLVFFRDDTDPVDQLPGPPRKPWIGNAWELLQTPAGKTCSYCYWSDPYTQFKTRPHLF